MGGEVGPGAGEALDRERQLAAGPRDAKAEELVSRRASEGISRSVRSAVYQAQGAFSHHEARSVDFPSRPPLPRW